jgi:hypothetical protein
MTNKRNILADVIIFPAIIYILFILCCVNVLSSASYKLVTYAYLASDHDGQIVLSFPVPKFILKFYWERFSRNDLFEEQSKSGRSFLFVANMIDGQPKEKIIHLDIARTESLAKQLLCSTESQQIFDGYKKHADKNLMAEVTREVNAYFSDKASFCKKSLEK